jgi:hypothetical protein
MGHVTVVSENLEEAKRTAKEILNTLKVIA